MPNRAEGQESNVGAPPENRRRSNAIIFIIVFALWLIADQLSKGIVSSMGYAGIREAGISLAGVFDLALVHNSGGAWGIFSDATMVLGVVSIIVSVLFFLYAIVFRADTPWLQVLAAALVCAGGIGNAIDRISLSYVVDFIRLTFIDFPVFNIADIGVTCGIVLFAITLLIELGSSRERGSSRG